MYTFVKPQIQLLKLCDVFYLRLMAQLCQKLYFKTTVVSSKGAVYQLISAEPDLTAQQGREQINDSWGPPQPPLPPVFTLSHLKAERTSDSLYCKYEPRGQAHLASSPHPYSSDFVMCEAAKKKLLETSVCVCH